MPKGKRNRNKREAQMRTPEPASAPEGKVMVRNWLDFLGEMHYDLEDGVKETFQKGLMSRKKSELLSEWDKFEEWVREKEQAGESDDRVAGLAARIVELERTVQESLKPKSRGFVIGGSFELTIEEEADYWKEEWEKINDRCGEFNLSVERMWRRFAEEEIEKEKKKVEEEMVRLRLELATEREKVASLLLWKPQDQHSKTWRVGGVYGGIPARKTKRRKRRSQAATYATAERSSS